MKSAIKDTEISGERLQLDNGHRCWFLSNDVTNRICRFVNGWFFSLERNDSIWCRSNGLAFCRQPVDFKIRTGPCGCNISDACFPKYGIDRSNTRRAKADVSHDWYPIMLFLQKPWWKSWRISVLINHLTSECSIGAMIFWKRSYRSRHFPGNQRTVRF